MPRLHQSYAVNVLNRNIPRPVIPPPTHTTPWTRDLHLYIQSSLLYSSPKSNGPLHTGNNIAQYDLHSSVCTGNCVVCNGGIGDIAQNELRSFAVQKFGRRSCAVNRLHRHLNKVCQCMRSVQAIMFIQLFSTVQ